jgi:transposase-like protein
MTKNATVPAPTSLLEAVAYFADKDRALDFMVQMRWPNGVVCPACEADKPSFLTTRRIWKCRDCRRQFSVKVGTIFEDSPLGMEKWLPALWMLANCRNGISSYELARDLGVTQKTAWFMLGRIRLAMQTKSFERTVSTVEIDECYVGGLAPNMHKSRRKRIMQGHKSGTKGKTGVVAGVRRAKMGAGSEVRAYVMKSVNAHPHGKIAREMALPGSAIYTDSATLYEGALDDYKREMVNHSAREYVRGEVHTNSVENFWSLLKRAIRGTYISVDPAHLFRYVDEQVFRFNVKDESEHNRFASVVRDVVGRRLTYAMLVNAGLNQA